LPCLNPFEFSLGEHLVIRVGINQYPQEHYIYWQQYYLSNNVPWQAPGMGENLSTLGMTEENVHIGDQYQLGDAIIEVSQPRSPCFKVNRKWGQTDLSMKMQMLSKCGWLYRVIKPGLLPLNTTMTMIRRDENSLSIKAVCDIYFGDPLNKHGLNRLLKLNKLSPSWQEKVITRLATGKVENWDFRLKGD
jgi:MOSC domain-containing protein YiiM